MSNQDGISRRTFVAGASVAAPIILASGVLAANGKPGANDRVITGHIGIGGMGRNHIKGFTENVGALCDVDTEQIAKATTMLKGEVKTYADYRRLLEDKDIDAVVIAAPDHWHALMMIDACDAGKAVYVEKPACKTIVEGRAMVDAAKRNKSVVQVGSQGRNHPGAVVLRDFIQSGQIGRIEKVVCWHNDNPIGGDPTKFGPAPKNLDWNMWLGPAADRAYNPDYCHKNFRWMIDLGGGQIRDRGAHVFSLVSWILGLDRTGPSRIEASGNVPQTGIWNCPTEFRVAYQFEKQDLEVIWEQPGEPAADFVFGATYFGTKGKTIARGGDGRVMVDEQVAAFAKAKNMPIDLPKGKRTHDIHRANWIDCVKSGDTPAMDIESGHRVASMCILANLAYRLERPVEWNARKEEFIKDDAANLLLGTPGRGEFHL